MITRMNHASFTVSNLDDSVVFFRDVLGLRLLDLSDRDGAFSERVTGIKGASLRIAYFDANNCRLELVQYLQPRGEKIDTSTNNVGSAHICFNVDDFDGFVNRLKKNNVKFAGEVCIIPGGPNKGKGALYFEDPDSNTFEIISNESVK